jgi:hypothetical protein
MNNSLSSKNIAIKGNGETDSQIKTKIDGSYTKNLE